MTVRDLVFMLNVRLDDALRGELDRLRCERSQSDYVRDLIEREAARRPADSATEPTPARLLYPGRERIKRALIRGGHRQARTLPTSPGRGWRVQAFGMTGHAYVYHDTYRTSEIPEKLTQYQAALRAGGIESDVEDRRLAVKPCPPSTLRSPYAFGRKP